MDIHGKALDSMFDDMDDMETKKMFGGEPKSADSGVSITISVTPNGGEPDGDEVPEMMNKGGMAGKACYSEGGVVSPESEESEDLSLPPFLRKKKKNLGV